MSIAVPADCYLDDPPCLREIDCRIWPKEAIDEGEEHALHFFVYFRSWDCWGGLPLNLAAIRMLQEYMAHQIGVEAGEIVATSKGLHLYDMYIDFAKRLVRSDVG
jgi:thymidylate synthase